MTVTAANAGRYPVSAQCDILGVPRSTYYAMRSRADAPKAPDPIEPDVLAIHEASRGRYGSRKTKAALARSGKTVSRRRICRIMREKACRAPTAGRDSDSRRGARVPSEILASMPTDGDVDLLRDFNSWVQRRASIPSNGTMS